MNIANEKLNTLPDNSNRHSILKPLHIQIRDYNINKAGKCKTSRSARRVRDYYGRKKCYGKYTISSLVNVHDDNRPYILLNIDSQPNYALLDSGANTSVIGGKFCENIIQTRKYDKCLGKVRTADGTKQNVLGSIDLNIIYNGKKELFRFLIIPSINQNIICGMDFWEKFDIQILFGNTINEIVVNEHEDTIPLNKTQQCQLKAIIDSFPNSERDGLGCTTLLEHKIDTGEASPIKQRYYPISPAREKLLFAEMDRMLDLGVIEECPGSPWSSPGVLIVKPGKVRFCVDSRRLNSVTVKDSYPIPNIDGLISRLPPVYFISKVDLKDAFWQIKLDESSKLKTAFTIPNRPLYQFTRMPFGLCNAPQTMCRLMDIVIPYYLKSNVFVYLDDLLIISEDFDGHLRHLHEVSTQLRKASLTININKSSFVIRKVQYLGYIIGEGSLMVDPSKVQAISEFPVPKSVRQLRRFLGMAGWYRRFIDDFAKITFSLTELLSKRKVFKWTTEAQTAFDKVKNKLTTAPVLVSANFAKPFILQCDASTLGVGAVLAQNDSDGNERPIAYMSQKLNKAQRNYSITELECFAVILAIKKFRYFIEGQEFKVITDHASLKWLMGQKDLTGRLARWALKLQGFVFTIEHRRGKDNVVPDALSRAFENEITVAEIELEILPSINLESPAFDGTEYSNWREEFSRSEFPDYKIIDKFIYKRAKFSDGGIDQSSSWKLLVPTELRNQILYAAHNLPQAAHGGIAKTAARIRKFFYWPGMLIDVHKYVINCDLCKTSKIPNSILKPPLGQMVETERPFQRLYVDLIGPFPRTKHGHIGILIILDHFSKFTFIIPLKKFISKPIVNYLRNDIFNCYGVPEIVVTDNGSQFKSREFEQFLSKYGVSHQCTAVHSPQSNASERVNRSINEALRSYIRDDQRKWDTYLSSINCALRNSVHQTTGQTPYELVFGQGMINHGHDYKILRNLKLLVEADTNLKRQDEFSILRASINSRIKKAYEKNARTYNLRARHREFSIGQEVIRRNFTQSSTVKNFNAKLAPVGVKAVVLKKIGQVNYELKDYDGNHIGIYHIKDIWT